MHLTTELVKSIDNLVTEQPTYVLNRKKNKEDLKNTNEFRHTVNLINNNSIPEGKDNGAHRKIQDRLFAYPAWILNQNDILLYVSDRKKEIKNCSKRHGKCVDMALITFTPQSLYELCFVEVKSTINPFLISGGVV